MSRSIHRPVRLAAALIALLMLSYASVRSTVMQVAMAAPAAAAPMCDGGMAMGADVMAPTHAPGLHKEAQAPAKSCPYCAATAQPPLASQPTPVRPSTAVQFVAYRTRCLHVARGPPARRPRVRDPPTLVLTV